LAEHFLLKHQNNMILKKKSFGKKDTNFLVEHANHCT